jgi:hypothetical protein
VTLRVDSHAVSQGFRRRVSLDGDSIVEVVIDNVDAAGFPAVGQRAEATISWPTKRAQPLRSHVDAAERLLIAYQRTGFVATCELRMQGAHYSAPIPVRGSRLSDDVLSFITINRVRPTDQPELLLIAAGDLAIEWAFTGSPSPVGCTCAITLVVARPLARFFREMHIDGRVFSQGEISQDIFANTHQPPLNAFAPIQVVEEL